ncbi:GGDEF domain-containing protein [Clostridium sp. MSJ-11]|uniref:GGDEF domain-containing protein n=1 Tax=Clostridium mobile TaxID=2841512 RepID=A0ABS6EBX8_9CLOT|nr:GGDEF domain-containing protein [Clostridium mobile]MBU5482708.1 GGDEF domain-containing protein [Clostridium mobile]
MKNSIDIKALDENLNFFNKMYDMLRIVDPLKKKVINHYGKRIEETGDVCFSYWDKENICDNCISIRAYIENETFIKLEHTTDKLFMITAIPIETKDNTIVLELFKDTTESMIIGNGEYEKGYNLKDTLVEMNDMVVKDSLTKTFNRRYINERLPADIIKSMVEEKPLSIIISDIDNFKLINDTFGHQIGDLVLKEISDTLISSFPPNLGWAARYGGDEFIICLSDTKNHEAFIIAEEVRKNIEEKIIRNKDEKIKLSVSFGVFTMHKEKFTAEEILNFADQNLYEAKNKGGNIVIK